MSWRSRILAKRTAKHWGLVLGMLQDGESCEWDVLARDIARPTAPEGYLLLSDRRLFFRSSFGVMEIPYQEITSADVGPGASGTSLLFVETAKGGEVFQTGRYSCELALDLIRGQGGRSR